MKEVHQYYAYDDGRRALLVTGVEFGEDGQYIRTTCKVYARFDRIYDAWRDTDDRAAADAATTPDLANSYDLAMAYIWATCDATKALAKAKKAARRTER